MSGLPLSSTIFLRCSVMHGGKFALIGLSGNIRIGSFLVAAEPCSFNSLSLLGVHKVGEFPIGINVRRGPRLL
jgi:hypothetical protein